MSSQSNDDRCAQTGRATEFALGKLSAAEAASFNAHCAVCLQCRREADSLGRVVQSFEGWPTDVLHPSTALWGRVLARIGSSDQAAPSSSDDWSEPEWEEAAAGIFCKLLSSDSTHDRVAMLVRLAPGVSYPPHIHSGVEELHLLDGELWIDDRKLYPGDHNRAERGTSDRRVWSETGCTCLLITAPSDVLG
jgi:anti-sigma factor ChrR (cupin superfamily)